MPCGRRSATSPPSPPRGCGPTWRWPTAGFGGGPGLHRAPAAAVLPSPWTCWRRARPGPAILHAANSAGTVLVAVGPVRPGALRHRPLRGGSRRLPVGQTTFLGPLRPAPPRCAPALALLLDGGRSAHARGRRAPRTGGCRPLPSDALGGDRAARLHGRRATGAVRGRLHGPHRVADGARLAGMVTMDQLVVDCGPDGDVAPGGRGDAPRPPGRRRDHGHRVGRAPRHHRLRGPVRHRATGAPGPGEPARPRRSGGGMMPGGRRPGAAARRRRRAARGARSPRRGHRSSSGWVTPGPTSCSWARGRGGPGRRAVRRPVGQAPGPLVLGGDRPRTGPPLRRGAAPQIPPCGEPRPPARSRSSPAGPTSSAQIDLIDPPGRSSRSGTSPPGCCSGHDRRDPPGPRSVLPVRRRPCGPTYHPAAALRSAAGP